MQTAGPSSSSAWMRGVVDIFRAQGVDPARLFEECGIDIARLELAHERFTIAEVSDLWETAIRLSGNPYIAIDRHLAARHMNYDLPAQAMWPSPDLLGGLKGLSRYLQLIDDSAAFDVQPQFGGAWIVLMHGIDGKVPRQPVEFGMLNLLQLCRRVTHKQVRPQALEFTFPEPADYHPYRMAFACPLRFGQPLHRMLLSDEDLALPLPAGASMFAVQEHAIEERLARLGHQRTTYRASEEIIRRLHLGEPSPAHIARRMELTEPLLHRRLKSEGTTFEKLVDEIRREMAGHYFAEPHFPLTRIHALLGFPSFAELQQATLRWFGMQPADYRHALVPGTMGR